jgi:hypothetical protein
MTAVPPRVANPGATRGGFGRRHAAPHVSEFQISEKLENFLSSQEK